MNVILVVEDEEVVRENLVELLTEKEYSVIQASNGQEALEILENFEIDLIITDLLMPVMDGMKFLERLKLSEATKSIPVIVLSAKTENRIIQLCVQNFIAEYISKPFDAALLYKAVARNLTN